MNSTIVDLDGFSVIGLFARTSNANEVTPGALIGRCWAELKKNDRILVAAGPTDSNIIAVYTDYASDHNGDYTYVLGARPLAGTERIPEGMVQVHVPGGRYAKLTSRRGPVAEVVLEVWQHVWALPSSELGGKRAYRADFEVYDDRSLDPASAVVDVFVGLE